MNRPLNPVPVADNREELIVMQDGGVFRSGRWLVRHVDMVIRQGEIVTLIGPNGSGKSTTVKMALGLIRPDEGQVTRKPGLCVGYVPQKLSIDWTMPLSVARFMSLTARPKAQQIQTALERVGIGHLAGANMHTLSGGEFQRAQLARALLRKPDILVLDEPVQGVDFSGESALYELIKAIRDELSCSILLISHDLHLVMAATDKVLCLNGHVCCQGTPNAVSNDAEYRRLFGARAAQTHAVYQHHHDHVHMDDGRVRHADGTVTAHCHAEDGHHSHDQAGKQEHDHA